MPKGHGLEAGAESHTPTEKVEYRKQQDWTQHTAHPGPDKEDNEAIVICILYGGFPLEYALENKVESRRGKLLLISYSLSFREIKQF